VVVPGGTGSGVVVLNPQDIYGPIVEAVEKEKVMEGPEPFNPPDQSGNSDDMMDVKTAWSDVLAKVEENVAAVEAAGESFAHRLDCWQNLGFSQLQAIPTHLEGFSSVFPASVPTPQWAQLCRNGMLWVLYAIWWLAAIKSVMSLRPGS
jgi:hypothetical protein